jgi:hypothetical protein
VVDINDYNEYDTGLMYKAIALFVMKSLDPRENPNGLKKEFIEKSFMLPTQLKLFYHVNLPRVNLNGIDLSGANLEGANLEGANLSGAYLVGTQISAKRVHRGTKELINLKGANLSNSIILWINKIDEGDLLIDSETNMENSITDSRDFIDYILATNIKTKGIPILCTSEEELIKSMRKVGHNESEIRYIIRFIPPNQYLLALEEFSQNTNQQLKGKHISEEEVKAINNNMNDLAKEVEDIKQPGKEGEQKEEAVDYVKQTQIEIKTASLIQRVLRVLPEAAETVSIFVPLSPLSELIGKPILYLVEKIVNLKNNYSDKISSL